MNEASSPDAAAYAALFEPIEVAGMRLRNRITMAPMTRRLAPDDCVPSEAMAAYYERRATGGVGLILTEGTHVDPEFAPDTHNVPGMWNEDQVAGWRRVVERVHAAGGAIACQLWHCGRLSMNPIGPSPLPQKKRDGGYRPTPRAMTVADMEKAASDFARAAKLSVEAGFDSVEIHGAHGYLLDSFLSPMSNRRTDEFGGGLENRARFPLMVVRAVREAVGAGYPVMYRFSQWQMDDYRAMAYPTPDVLEDWVGMLREAGVDVLHVSTRDATDPGFAGSEKTLAGWTRELSGLPTVAVGRVSVSASMDEGAKAETTDPRPAAELVERGEADLVAVGRSLIANPDWCEKVRSGRWEELRPYDRDLLETLAD